MRKLGLFLILVLAGVPPLSAANARPVDALSSTRRSATSVVQSVPTPDAPSALRGKDGDGGATGASHDAQASDFTLSADVRVSHVPAFDARTHPRRNVSPIDSRPPPVHD